MQKTDENAAHPHLTGTQINYYHVCHRKLWLFSRNIQMEHESDVVFQGKMLGDASYERRKKEISIGSNIVLDSFDRQHGIIHEIKKSRAIEKAHIQQVKYYIYYLQKLGIRTCAEIEYPLLKRKEKVELSEKDIKELEDALEKIKNIINSPEPPLLQKKSICRKCSYFELCYI